MEPFKKAWTLQLYSEYDDICFRHRVRLQKPLIRIMDFQSRWGHWDSESRTLAIATRLITEHSWPVVLEVFKHEIAHQYVDEALGIPDLHGSHFKEACERLGVEKWAQKAEIHTSQLSELQSSKRSEENALFRRIERLLALAQSTNEHEALAAMNKVSELHEKYQIDQLKLEEAEEFHTLCIDHKLRRLPSYHGILASILTSYFSVKVIFSSLYDKEKMCEHKVLEILGRAENTKLAEYVYWYLYNMLNILWIQYQEKNKVQGLAAKNTYYSGVLNGFESKMRVSRKERTQRTKIASNEKSLIVLEQKRLEDYVHFKHPRLHTMRSVQRRSNAKIYEDGIARGRELSIHDGLNTSKGATMKYLERSRL